MEKLCLFYHFRLLLVHSLMVPWAMSSTNFTDQMALLTFKTQINLNPTNILVNNWTAKTSFCNWIGVSCSLRRQRVTALNLSSMALRGTISPHIGNLSFLVSLDLGNNNFHGHLPPELGHLHRLRVINMQSNQLEGTIPSSLSQCEEIQELWLKYNNFTGEVPKWFGMLTQIRIIYLDHNNLAGNLPPSLGNASNLEILLLDANYLQGDIPKELGNLQKLKWLALAENYLTGSIPSTIFNISSLQIIDVTSNRLFGSLSRDMGSLSKLRSILLGVNNFTGSIPPSLGNSTRLEELDLRDNDLVGDIVEEIGNLVNLQKINLEWNYLTGEIPQVIFNISSLAIIALDQNRLSGKIPSSFGLSLPNLELVYLGDNQIGGEIPISISNASNLIDLDLAYNFFIGSIPMTLGNLRSLRFLNLGSNRLTGNLPTHALLFLTSLVNCKDLESLYIFDNPLNGILPESIGNLSTSLQDFLAYNCQINGIITRGIGNLSSLIRLGLQKNNLGGTIPSTIKRLSKLQGLYLDGNRVQGSIPDELCSLTYLVELSLHENELSASMPSCIGNLSMLNQISLASNTLSSAIPRSLWSLKDILYLNLSRNFLDGYLPSEVGQMKVVDTMDLSSNQLSGDIPSTLGGLQSLKYLNLSHNSFQGYIPESFGDMISSESIDLSSNTLSGTIPKSLEKLRYLKGLNLSFNRLQGEIPSGGVFSNLTAQSLMGNNALCGMPKLNFAACPAETLSKSKTKSRLIVWLLLAIASLIIIVGLLSLLILYRLKKRRVSVPVEISPETTLRIISYYELFRATNRFCEANLLGIGSFGSVYKGILSDGMVIAVKVLNLQLEGASKSFDVECGVMRMVRHRNLVKIISTCTNLDFRALVLQYMANGSLDKWLYSHNCYLDLLQRINIMIDVASALEYLHHGYSEPIVHCDLKPSNVLLNEDMVGHVADFGIAKILAPTKSTTQTKTIGTIGYIAPEYGSQGRVSTKGDVYSYGIMLMEMFIRKKPTDELFSGTLNMRQWVNAYVSNALMEIVDANLLKENGDLSARQYSVSSIIELALLCSKESPEERIEMKDVVVSLNAIKQEFLVSANGIKN